MEKVKQFLTSNKAKGLYWQIGNLILLLIIGLVTETGFYPALLLPILNVSTKYINTNYIQNKK